MNQSEKLNAVRRLRPGQGFGVSEDLTIVDLDDIPTDAEILAAHKLNELEKTDKEEIAALENQLTMRNLRAAILGDAVAIDKIRDIETALEPIRIRGRGRS